MTGSQTQTSARERAHQPSHARAPLGRIGESELNASHAAPRTARTAARTAAGEESGRTVLSRVSSLLGAFDHAGGGLSVTELGRRTHLPKSTAFRLAEQMVSLGWLERDPAGYRVGARMLEIGGAARRRSRLRNRAMPHLSELAASTGLAVNLAVLDGDQVVIVEQIPMRDCDLPTIGRIRFPAATTSLGKAMLAFSDAAPRRGDTAGRSTGADEAAVAEVPGGQRWELEMAAVRRRGVAFDVEQTFPGIACVGVPVRNSGRAIAAVSVSAPVRAMRPDTVVPALTKVAAAVWASLFSRNRLTISA